MRSAEQIHHLHIGRVNVYSGGRNPVRTRLQRSAVGEHVSSARLPRRLPTARLLRAPLHSLPQITANRQSLSVEATPPTPCTSATANAGADAALR